jgi:uncharacterized membrane-anchored protein
VIFLHTIDVRLGWRDNMNAIIKLACATGLALSFGSLELRAQSEQQYRQQIENLGWQKAPGAGSIGSVARIKLENSLRFLGAADSSKFIELNGNPPRSDNYVLAPWPLQWFAVFKFDGSGYIRDDEKLDASDLLNTLKKQNEAGMAERRRLGLPVLRLMGWAVDPHYDLGTKRLEWGTRYVTEGSGEETANYTIRILGRSGVMSVVLVSDPSSLTNDVQAVRMALRGFEFVPGERYSEFREGDKVAEYGLAALIVGGAAAAAAKSGVLKGLGKFIGIGALALLAAVGAFLRSLFKSKKS